MDITLNQNGGYIERRFIDRTLRIEATDLKLTSTGIHAQIDVSSDDIILAYDYFNIKRDSDRTRLANKAWKSVQVDELVDEDGAAYTNTDLRLDIDLFARQIWPDYIESQGPEETAGDVVSEISFLAKPHIINGGGTILFGRQGSGKSYAAMLMAIAVDSGTNGIWSTGDPVRTMFINLERSAESIARRVACCNGALGLDPERSLLTLNRRGTGLAALDGVIKNAVEKYNIGFIVVDSISRTGVGDLNSNEAGNKGIDALNSWGISWLALGHVPRDSTEHVYGSTMFDAGADIMLRLTGSRENNKVGVNMEVTKENDIGPQESMMLEYQFDQRGLLHVSHGDIQNYPELLETRRKTFDEEISDVLSEGESTSLTIANTLKKQQSNVTRSLKKGLESGKFAINRKEGQQIFYVLAEDFDETKLN